jgi:serine/threonine protein kinase
MLLSGGPRAKMSDTVVLETSPLPGHRAGDVIAGKYRLERELGRGAMGTVWLAMHTTLGQRVAIKLIAFEQSQSVEARRRFSLEAKAAARLRSRHVVAVYDDGETPDGTPYIVMEYLDGETLEERLERQPDMSLGEAVRITSHVGRALARAHAQGVVHRDLKSGNIFIAKTDDDEIGWVAKVLDFGVAKLADTHGPSATKTGTIVGTPLFMSPEQIRGASQVDHRADLYSLGMVFYNMVTGSHAFDGPSYSDVLVSICTQTLPDIRLAAPWLPAGVRSWFDKACARERDDRFQSADEMVEALLEAAGPAGRTSQPSITDEIGGPSGTLVGYAPPEAAATIVQTDSPFQNVALPAEPLVGSSGTLRSRVSTGVSDQPSIGTTRGSLALWAAAGVGLAVVAMLIVTAVTRATTSRPPAPTREVVAARETPEPPTTVPPSPAPPAAVTTATAANSPAEPAISPEPAAPAAPAAASEPAVRREPARNTGSTRRVRGDAAAPALANTAPEQPAAARNQPSSPPNPPPAMPDMGF